MSAFFTEKELLYQITEGNELAFKSFVHLYGKQLYPYLVKFTQSPEVAEDLSQEIFLKVWLKRDLLPSIEDVKAWIFTIAANTARSWLRKKLSNRRLIREYDAPERLSSVIDELDFREINNLLDKAIQSLPPQRKQIYIMQRVEGKKLSEIASELNISLSTVKNTLTAALEAIRKYIEKYDPLLVLILFHLWQ